MTGLEFHSFPGTQMPRLWEAASRLRWDVFVAEQEVPPVLEIDARDFQDSTLHLVAVDSAGVQAAGRLLTATPSNYYIGRVVVDKRSRGKGYGKAIIEYAVNESARLLPPGENGTVTLDAQEQAIGFYEMCGFELTDAPRFLDAGIWHRTMVRPIVSTRLPAEAESAAPLD